MVGSVVRAVAVQVDLFQHMPNPVLSSPPMPSKKFTSNAVMALPSSQSCSRAVQRIQQVGWERRDRVAGEIELVHDIQSGEDILGQRREVVFFEAEDAQVQ